VEFKSLESVMKRWKVVFSAFEFSILLKGTSTFYLIFLYLSHSGQISKINLQHAYNVVCLFEAFWFDNVAELKRAKNVE